MITSNNPIIGGITIIERTTMAKQIRPEISHFLPQMIVIINEQFPFKDSHIIICNLNSF